MRETRLTEPRSAQAARSLSWERSLEQQDFSVETVALRDGFDLVLSRIGGGEECQFHHSEPTDVFGIGFHLKGGARFSASGQRFETRPLDVWAAAAPQSSRSSFSLPASGFETVSLRFSPECLRELLGSCGYEGGILDMMARSAHEFESFARLVPLAPPAAATVRAMLSSRYTGAARALFLESCALALLAAQIDAQEKTAARDGRTFAKTKMVEARAFLDETLAAPPSILELARIVGVNDFKLKRDFKASFGVTIFGYVRQRRMELAACNLNAGMSVAAAARTAGYECPRCFADAFRRCFGILPSRMAPADLEMIPIAPVETPRSVTRSGAGSA